MRARCCVQEDDGDGLDGDELDDGVGGSAPAAAGPVPGPAAGVTDSAAGADVMPAPAASCHEDSTHGADEDDNKG